MRQAPRTSRKAIRYALTAITLTTALAVTAPARAGPPTRFFVDPAGVPVVDFGPPAVEQHGNVNDLGEMVLAACRALAG
jgi:hypothetical protein